MKAQRKKQSPMPQQSQREEPTWVLEAREHFQQNGYYRASDLQRLLGDPGTSVTSTAGTEPSENNLWKKVV